MKLCSLQYSMNACLIFASSVATYIGHLYRECHIPPTSGSPADQDLKYNHLLKLRNSSVKPRDARSKEKRSATV
ncbi:hypothetical protein WN944_007520 [Citrus x changshan-huyou]|uniref:Uncharacterized protein n=1 Tax=Citrus x changshan-huyou TaxID=2935761 RepID=A0AAP0MSK2_9ROSI